MNNQQNSQQCDTVGRGIIRAMGVYNGMLVAESSTPNVGFISVKVKLYDGALAQLDFVNLVQPRGVYALAGIRMESPTEQPRENRDNGGV